MPAAQIRHASANLFVGEDSSSVYIVSNVTAEGDCDDYRLELNYFIVMSAASTCHYYDCGSKIERYIRDVAAECELFQCSPLNEEVNYSPPSCIDESIYR